MLRILNLLFLVLLASCATPIAPTGGQPIRTSPQILSTFPEQGTTHFDKREVRFEFNRFMNRGSATRALRIEPDLGIPYTIRWKRKVMILSFNESLPDSVTVIVRLGMELSDIDNNRLSQPYQLAFSTGATVDSAGVDINTISFEKTRGEAGITVGLFKETALDQAAIYMAESDTSGIVRFRNATPGSYIAVLIDDRNRNRRIDAGERHFPAADPVVVTPDSIYAANTIVYSSQDTVPPSVLGVGLLSNNRLRIRFSEPIRLSRSSSIEVEHSGRSLPAYWLYSDQTDPTVAYANTMDAMVPSLSYSVNIRGVTDFARNTIVGNVAPFTGSNQQDTTQLRIVRMPEAASILPSDSILVVYSKAISGSNVVDSLIVIDGERTLRSWPDIRIEQNRLYVYREGGWRSGQSYQLRFWDPLQQRHSPITFRPLSDSELGSLEVEVESIWKGQRIVLEVIDKQGETIVRREGVGPFLLADLLPVEVSLRLWLDLNGNGRWDGGKILPIMVPHEPIEIKNGIPISPRMTTVVQMGSIN
jgi:hypothetical protein